MCATSDNFVTMFFLLLRFMAAVYWNWCIRSLVLQYHSFKLLLNGIHFVHVFAALI